MKMSIKSKFCKTLTRLQEKEMQNFIEAFEKNDIERASRTLDSLGFINEINESVCEIKKK